MEVRPAGRPIDTREVQPKKPQSLIAVTLLGTSTWPCASGVYRQPASTPPSASSSKVTGRIAVVPVGNWASGFSSQSAKTMQWPNACDLLRQKPKRVWRALLAKGRGVKEPDTRGENCAA